MLSQNSKPKPDIVPILEYYGFTIPKNTGGWQSVRCAFHGDKVKSARLNIESGGYRCFGCDMAGDVYSIIMKREGVVFSEAIKFAERITGVSNKELRSKPRNSSALPDESRYSSGNGTEVPFRLREGR